MCLPRPMIDTTRLLRLLRLLSGLIICALLTAGRAGGQADQMPSVLGAIDSHPGDSVRGASAANVYVSVREPNGLPVTESATVTLSCPLQGVKLSGPTKSTALAQFSNIPAGDCFVEVSAPGYKTTRERAPVTDSLVSINQYVYVYLHPASESGRRWQTKSFAGCAERNGQGHGGDAQESPGRCPQTPAESRGQLTAKSGRAIFAGHAGDQPEPSPRQPRNGSRTPLRYIRRTNTRCWRWERCNCATKTPPTPSATLEKAVQANTMSIVRSITWRRPICNNRTSPTRSCTRRRRSTWAPARLP